MHVDMSKATTDTQPDRTPANGTDDAGEMMGKKRRTVAQEHSVLSGQPVAVFTLTSGKRLRVFPKPQGYFYKIDEAIAEYLVALVKQERLRAKPVWVSFVNRFRRHMAVDHLEQTKYELLRLIFEDKYTPERHTELTVDEYVTMSHDLVVQILESFRRANDVSDILRVLIPDYDKKKELNDSVTGRDSMRI